MSRIRLIALFTLLIGSNIISFGQQMQGSSLSTPKEYYLQVKQFGEFIDRFNYKSDWKGNLIGDEFKKKISRTSYLAYLLNAEDPRLSNPTDSSYRKICSEFIAYITDSTIPKTINLYSGQVKALAKVNITYNGKDNQVNMELIPEVLSDKSAKWVISNIDTDIFRFSPDSLQKYFIAPNSHETNFINIRKLNSTNNPYYFTSPSLTKTILFLKEVEQKRITIQNTQSVTYYINFPGWQITVEEFNRTSNNSGWLISDIRKI
ncbi:MAG: hypothetical protein HXX16_06590 [Bacteroidales bacterium]|nr:hypothetical protein [Bacteroidales bacterium]